MKNAHNVAGAFCRLSAPHSSWNLMKEYQKPFWGFFKNKLFQVIRQILYFTLLPYIRSIGFSIRSKTAGCVYFGRKCVLKEEPASF